MSRRRPTTWQGLDGSCAAARPLSRTSSGRVAVRVTFPGCGEHSGGIWVLEVRQLWWKCCEICRCAEISRVVPRRPPLPPLCPARYTHSPTLTPTPLSAFWRKGQRAGVSSAGADLCRTVPLRRVPPPTRQNNRPGSCRRWTTHNTPGQARVAPAARRRGRAVHAVRCPGVVAPRVVVRPGVVPPSGLGCAPMDRTPHRTFTICGLAGPRCTPARSNARTRKEAMLPASYPFRAPPEDVLVPPRTITSPLQYLASSRAQREADVSHGLRVTRQYVSALIERLAARRDCAA